MGNEPSRRALACCALIAAALAPGCSNEAGPRPCSGALPGVEVTLVLEPDPTGARPPWTGTGELVLYEANDLQDRVVVDVDPAAFDAAGRAVVALAFPPRARTGYYGLELTASDTAQGGTWKGGAAFAADPTQCHRVELEATYEGVADAGPCEQGRPGVNVFFEGASGPGYGAELGIRVGDAVRSFSFPGDLHLNDAGPRSAAFPYPVGALAGPGSVDYYYPGPGIINTVGHADFQADPAACVGVTLTLTETSPFDAGPPDATR